MGPQNALKDFAIAGAAETPAKSTGVYMAQASRSTVALIATTILAMLFLIRGTTHPGLNYDVIPYVALAKEMRSAGGKVEAYRELASQVGDSRFQLYVSGPYRERMYRDDQFFQINQPLYTIRPFYIFLCSVVGAAIHDDVAATYIISASAAALAVLLSYVLAGSAGLTGNWRLAVPLTWIVAGGLDMAGLSTPDAVETLLSLLFVLVSLREPWGVVRATGLLLLAILMIATRTDGLLFVVFLLLMEWMLAPRHRVLSTLLLLGALSAYLVIERLSGNYGYVALLNFAFLDGPSRETVPNLVPNLAGYVRTFVHQTLQILGESPQFTLLIPAVAALAFAWCRERRLSATLERDTFNQRALILSAALALCLIARFILFPLPFSRYMMNAYVLAGILFARAIQPPAGATHLSSALSEAE
jgi:hypothetical protein